MPLIGKNSDFILIIFLKKKQQFNASLEQQFYFNHAAEGQHE